MHQIFELLKNIIIPLLIALFLSVSVFMILNRIHYQVLRFRKRVAKAKVDVFLTSLLFSPLDEKEFAVQINEFKKKIPFRKKWCKAIILNELINLKRNLKGQETRANIHFIYEEFGLYEYSLRFLKNGAWYIKSMALYHFQALEYTKAVLHVTPYLNHKNAVLSANAYIAFISLASDKLDFLIDYKNNITFTSIIKIMDILHTKRPAKPSNLKDWLKSENASIVKLGLRIMVFYNESGYPQDIVELYSSEDESVRKEAIMASGELFISGAEDELIFRFEKETKPNQIEILKTLAAIGTEASENFLNQILGRRLDPDIKLEAAYSLNAVNPGCFKNLENYTDAVRKMVLQVKDPHI